jgi:predicted transposase/invertase (TIGR01784 family)
LDDITLHFFELPKWQKSNNFDINNPLDRWLQFFTNPNFYTMISLEERQMLDKIYNAVDLLDTKNYTIEQLRGYDQFIDNIMIRETDLDEAEKRGKAEGIELGRELASDEMMLIIVDIKKMDLTIEQIAEKYNTSQERVFRLKSLIF